MLSNVRFVDRTLPALAVLSFTVACFGGSAEFAPSAAGPEPGQQAAVPAGHADQPDHASAATEHAPASGDHGSAHWSYDGPGGPSSWGSISPEFSACREGNRQSPIDLSSAQSRDLSEIGFGYRPTTLAIVNNGHTIQINHFGDSYISVGRWPYRLRQFHFHSPSEHTIEGRHAEVEMHLVHQDEQGRLAVVGVMIESGAYNAAFEDAWQHLPREAGEPQIFQDAFVDPDALLPVDRTFFQYSGSLTTPPCSEGVSWYVMASPISMSPEQIAELKQSIEGNNRPIQERYGRALYTTSRR
jgi:carbonic anhydrase